MLFSQRTYKYEGYKKLANILVDSAVVLWIMLFILRLIFNWGFSDYINFFVESIFVVELVVGSIPDFLEKDRKSVFWDIIIIFIVVFIFFVI